FFAASSPALGQELWKTTPTPKAQLIAVGAGAGNMPLVRAYDAATGKLRFTILAAPSTFRGGVRVAVGAGNVDGTPDIITGAGPGGTPLVRVFDGLTGTAVQSFYAFPTTFAGGVTVASADENGDGVADVVAGAGASYAGGPAVAVFSGVDDARLLGFAASDPHYGGRVRVAAADLPGP